MFMDRGDDFNISVPRIVLSTTTAQQLAVYCSIRSYARNGNGVCFATAEQIALRAHHLNRKTVYSAAKTLCQLGYLEMVGKKIRSVGGKPVNHYKVCQINPQTDLLESEEHGNEMDLQVSPKNPISKTEKYSLEALKGSKKSKLSEDDYEEINALLTEEHIANITAEFNIMGYEVQRVWKKMINSRIANNKPYPNWISGLRVWIQSEIDDRKIIKQEVL